MEKWCLVFYLVARVDQLMGLCERLEQSLKRAEEKSEKIFNAIAHHLQTSTPHMP